MKLIVLSVLLLTGCSSTNISKLVHELGKDPATVAISVQSVYGTVYFLRTGMSNQTVTMGPIQLH